MQKLVLSSILVATLVLVLGVAAEAQQPKKVPRIGYISPADPGSESTRSEPIRRALRERGYIEGQNIAIEYRYAEGCQRDNRSARGIRIILSAVSAKRPYCTTA
jgi:hypothetical protein